MSKKFNILPLLVCFSLVGCASIIGESVQQVPISSTPDGATVVITDETGKKIYKGKTPTTIALQKSDGSYFGGKDYTVKISKPGYHTQSVAVTANANGWYIFGNIAFGGLIGWFIVDPLSGAMYTLSPEAVDANLRGSTSHNNRATDGSISIVLLEDVPQSLRPKMKRIN